MTFHPIQTQILHIIRTAPDGLRYSKMKPSTEIENDLFNYHLQQLVKRGLVHKNRDLYSLTPNGKALAMELQPLDEQNQTGNKFKMAALCLVLNDGKVLYQTRALQPFTGHREIIGGAINRGERATDAASRRITEEAGLSADFQLFGLIRKMRYDETDTLYSDILYHVCISHNPTGELIVKNEYGQHNWISFPEAIKIERESSYGCIRFGDELEELQKSPPTPLPLFYFEEEYRQNIY